MLFHKKNKQSVYPYDPAKERPVIRASICNGEQVAGFKEFETGTFHEVMFIRTPQDLELFKKTYALEKVDKEY